MGGKMIVFDFNREAERRKALQRVCRHFDEMLAVIEAAHESGGFTTEQAEKGMRLAAKIVHDSDEREPILFALKLMSELRWVDGVDQEFWGAVYSDLYMRRTCQGEQKDRGATRTESDLHEYLVDNWTTFFSEGLRLVRHEYKVGPGRVDFLAEDRDGFILIECKTGTINLKALNQLQNYMYNHGVSRGILVGANCEVLLPPGISFKPHQDLYKVLRKD